MLEEQKPTSQFKNSARKESKISPLQFKKSVLEPAQPDLQFQEDKPSHVPNYDYAHFLTVNIPTTPPPITPSLAMSPPFSPETSRPIFTDPQVEQYYLWLQQNNAVTFPDAVIQAYENAALEIKQIGSQSVRTFAPFREETSAFHVITIKQIVFLALLCCLWLIGLLALRLTMVTVTIGAITFLYIFGFLTSSILVTKSSHKKSGEWISEKIIQSLDQLGAEWPTYTILCPLFKEVAVVPQFVEAMRALNYPAHKLQVLFLTEQSDAQTRIALEQMRLPSNFIILTVPKGTIPLK